MTLRIACGIIPVMRHDLLVLDLDGTLLAPDGTVSARNRAAVRDARAAGLDVVIATGRAMVESRDAIAAIEHEVHDGEVICAGGAIRQSAAHGTTLDRIAMDHVLVDDIVRALLGHGHRVLLLKDPQVTGYDYLSVGDAPLDPASAWWFETMPVTVRDVASVADDPHPADTIRVGAVATEAELAPIARDLKRDLGERVFLQHWGAVTETEATGSATHLLEAFEPRVNKWTMVERYCRAHGIDRARVAAIGDGLNDVELIRGAATGIAMGNADPRVAAVADRTTATAADDGVAEAIAHLLEGAW